MPPGAAISQYQLRCDWPLPARLTDPGRLHITSASLGNVEDTDEARLSSALADVPMTPLYLKLARAEMFSGGIAVLRVEESRDLEHLQATLPPWCKASGFPSTAGHGCRTSPSLAKRSDGMRALYEAACHREQSRELVKAPGQHALEAQGLAHLLETVHQFRAAQQRMTAAAIGESAHEAQVALSIRTGGDSSRRPSVGGPCRNQVSDAAIHQ